ncbi:MAG TPA: diacylglycerol kinase family protein [Planctomycetota bacterium]|nr:diacylglycerol kinase family protein [Planctomycetota bacterium]
MRARLIINPVAGTDQGSEVLPDVNVQLRERFDAMDIVMTTGVGDAVKAAEDAARSGYEVLIAAGGDGTLNEVLNGAAQVPGALDAIQFGLIPLGTGNDFSHALGLSEDVDETLRLLKTAQETRLDLCHANDDQFVNVSAGGFVAEVSESVDPSLKSLAGKFAYILGGAQVLMDYEPVQTRCRFEADGSVQQLDLPLQMFAACNSRYIGGGRLIAPEALVDDGLLDVCLVEAMPTLEFIAVLAKISGGTHTDDPRVRYFKTPWLELNFSRPTKINTDGEVRETSTCRYSVEPRRLRFLAAATPFSVNARTELNAPLR